MTTATEMLAKLGLSQKELIDAFHVLYYESLGWDRNQYLGFQIKQCPFDLQVYQELLFRTRPAGIIQTGVAGGGSLLFFAHLLDLIQMPADALVIGVDLNLTREARALSHPRIRLVQGSSTDEKVIEAVRRWAPKQGGLVSLDSGHRYAHVAAELRLYQEFVAVGSYLVVEDTNVNGHPVFLAHGPGPLEAVDEFLRSEYRFHRDDLVWQGNLFSHHQGGWLKRMA